MIRKLLHPSRSPLLNWVRAATGIGLAIAIPLAWSQQAAIAQPLQAQDPTSDLAATQVNVLFVNPTAGDDTLGNGSQQAPIKTITHALRLAQSNTVILLTAGMYSDETGEVFPLTLKPGVTIQGDPRTKGQEIVIQGGSAFLSPTFARQNITILGADQAGLSGVTVTNPNPRGYGLWIESSSPTVVDNTFTGNTHDGISVTGNSAPLIQGNHFFKNGANGITVYGTSRPEIVGNQLEQTGFAINMGQNAAPRIVGNRIIQNKDGVVAQVKARPILRNNLIEGNERDGVVAIAQAQPDLGTAAEPGGNVFQDNGRFDINSQASSQTLVAFGNTLSRTQGRIDLIGTANLEEPAPESTAINRPVLTPATPPRPQPQPPSPTTAQSPASTPALPTLEAATPSFPTSTQAASREERPLPTSQPAISASPSASTISAASFPVPKLPGSAQPTNPGMTATPKISPVISQRSPATTATGLAPVEIISTQPEAIAIPVPTPTAAPAPKPRVIAPTPARPAANLPKPTVAVSVKPGQEPATPSAIEISVPPPETGAAFNSPRVTAAVPTSSVERREAEAGGVLPVPNLDIPMGNTGDFPTLSVVETSSMGAGSPPSPPNRANALGLSYRVVVDATTESQQTQVRSLVPGAFRVRYADRTVMQVGAYSDRTQAEEMQQIMASQGWQATIVQAN